MDILTRSKETLNARFGRPTFAEALIGGFRIESCWEYDFGGTLKLRVGFYNDIARYSCFVKRTLEPSLKFASGEVGDCLSAIAAGGLWSPNPYTATAPVGLTLATNYRCTDAGVTVLAWHRDDKPYVFAYIPSLLDQPPVIPSRAALDAKFPTICQVIKRPEDR
ncbi:MAG: hypothetical protein ACJ8M4_10055 [Chthoniobacterales bacterium]